MGDAI
jgi:hypothetical protein